MRKIEHIKAELDQCNDRLSEMGDLRNDLAANVEAMRLSFLAGDVTGSDFSSGQGRLADTDGAIAALQITQSRLTRELEAAEAAAGRVQGMSRLEAIANEGVSSYNDYLKARSDADDQIRHIAADLFDKKAKALQAKNAFQDGLDRLGEWPETIAQLKAAGVSDEAIAFCTRRNLKVIPTGFGELVSMIEGQHQALMDREEMRQRKAASR